MNDETVGRGAVAARDTSPATNVVSVGIATFLTAAMTWLTLIVAARSLGPTAYAEFAVFWGLLFAAFGAAMGLFNETVRAVSTSLEQASPAAGCRPVRVSLVLGGVLGLTLLVSSPVWAPAVFAEESVARVGLVALGVWSFSVLVGVNGVLGGSGAWTTYAGVITADAALRLALVISAATLGGPVIAFALAASAASLVWLPAALVSARVRHTPWARADVPARAFVRGALLAMVGTASTAVLVTGFPALIEITSPGRLGPEAGVLVAGVMVTRAPLLIPLGAFQGVAIRHFVRNRHRLLVSLGLPMVGTGAVTSVVAVGALVVGPWIMVTAFGSDFELPGATLALLTLSAGAIALLTMTGAAVVAAGRHVVYAVGWLTATAATVGLLLLPGPLTTRVVLALGAGPLAGMVVHLMGARAGSTR